MRIKGAEKEPKLLVIDTSTRRSVVAVASASGVLAQRFHEHPMSHGEQLLPMVMQVLDEALCNLEDVNLLAVGKGPGSFTGVRVGMASAKGIAFSQSIPVVGVGSLEAMSQAAAIVPGNMVGEAPVLALLDAKKSEVFAGMYAPDGALITGPDHVPQGRIKQWIEAACSHNKARPVIVGEIAQSLDLGGVGTVISNAVCDLPHPEAIAMLALRRWLATKQDEVESLEPLYVRPPDITKPSTAPRVIR